MTYKIYVLDAAGRHQLHEVSESGQYVDESKVLYDERTQGPMSAGALAAAQAQVQTDNMSNLTYILAQRQKEYPTPDKFVEACYDRDERDDTTKLTAYYAEVAAVKARWPKPA